MHNVEIEDFYHHDFTTASEWEVFIARLEEIIHEWKLPQTKIGPPLKPGDFMNSSWEKQCEELNFADVSFILKHYKLKFNNDNTLNNTALNDSEDSNTQAQIDVLNMSNNFAKFDDEHSEIAQYYGIREFIVLTPAKRIAISDETRIKILLSSLTIASNNANSEIPALVQVQEPWQQFYLGVSVGRGTSSHLDMIHLKKIPPHCRHLTGLLALFKQKIGEGCGIRLDPVMVSIRFTYLLKDWTNYTWTQEPPDFDFMQGETVGVDELGKLPFGAAFDPVGELQLYTTWPKMSENVVVDSESFTDLEPQLATEWSAQVNMISSSACLLSEYLSDFLHLCGNQKSMVDLLGDGAIEIGNNDSSLSSALNILTESKIPTISRVMGRAASIKKHTKNLEGPIPEDVLISILYFLFPDADELKKAPYADVSGYNVDDDMWKGVKTCAIDGLVWRLAIVAAHCTHNLGGAAALAQLWHEFIQEIHFRWERGIAIPGVGIGFPDTVRTCLLHQKLQMMNCCIERKRSREESAYKQQHTTEDDFDSESEDEFYECTEEDAAKQDEVQYKRALKLKHLLWNRPSGRLAKHPSLRLLKTGEPLYLPITQDPGPKTEDQLEADAEVMMQLGTDKYASEMRARLMTASLLSDMGSFKAANPESELADFIRWYSPRDWIEDDGTDEWGQPVGHLSQRMEIPNNPWVTTWSSAQSVPAHRQRRLFDDTREAEKAIHYLITKFIGEIAQLILPVLMHASLFTLNQQKQDALPNLPDVVQNILYKLQYATKPIHQKLHLYEEIARDIESVEGLVAQVNSLQHKFCDEGHSKEMAAFIIQLMRGKEVAVEGGERSTVGQRITAMFREAQKANYLMGTTGASSNTSGGGDEKHKIFPEPSCKEFILRAVTPRPSPTSTPQPQRLYVCLKRDYIRLAGFFCEDTTFL